MDRETAIRAAVNLLAAAAPPDSTHWEDAIVLDFLATVDPDRNAYRIDKVIRGSAHRPMPSHFREMRSIKYVQVLPDLLPVLEAHILKWPENPNREAALQVCRGVAAWNIQPQDDHGRIFVHDGTERPASGDEVCFTGFGDERRFTLERSARLAGLAVVPRVSVHLRYLCAGPNAGPSKLRKALQQGVRIVDTEEELAELLTQGTLPG